MNNWEDTYQREGEKIPPSQSAGQRSRRASGRGAGWTILTIAFLILVLGFVSFGGYVIYRILPPPPPAITVPNSTTIITQVQSMGKLETVSYTMEKVVTYDPDANSWLHFLGSHQKLFVVYGTVVAGFDLTKLNKSDVQIQGPETKNSSLTLNMPAPQILSSNFDPKKTVVYDVSTGVDVLWSENLNANTVLKITSAAQQSLRTEACQEGVLLSASNSVKPVLTSLLSNLGYHTVTINVAPGTCS